VTSYIVSFNKITTRKH